MRFPAGTRGLALGVFDASNFRAKAFFRLTSTPFTRLPLIATRSGGGTLPWRSWYSPYPRIARDVAIYQRHRADDNTITNGNPFLNDRLRTDVNTRADPCRSIFHFGSAPRQGSLHCVVRVDVYPGTNIDVITD